VKISKVPEISEQARTPIVCRLLELIRERDELIQQLKDEIAVLKGQKTRPKITPSKMDEQSGNDLGSRVCEVKRPGSQKRNKTAGLKIHETRTIQPEVIPPGSTFEGYDYYVVQDIVIRAHNIRYRLGRWLTAEGEYVVGELPDCVKGWHFGPTLVSYILYQYHHNHVTQPLILEELREWEVDISSGEIHRILTEGKERFHEEKDEILRAGLEVSRYVNVDDTGARHAGKNGYCTHIGNEFFAWFQSTESKSRINFLELLRAGHGEYIITCESIEYMDRQGLPKGALSLLSEDQDKMFVNQSQWEAHLEGLGIRQPRHVKIATEGALIGSIVTHGVSKDLVILSDDAGQYNVLLHALCWIHAERTIHKIIPFNDAQRNALEEIRSQIWQLYADLKAYKGSPDEVKKAELEDRFDVIFSTKTCFATLNQALKRLQGNKAELLLVLERPELPLHNNTSERDIREYVKRRKVSGGTRSDSGRRCRDTFTTLKKTSRKSGIRFWDYLLDRVSQQNIIPSLAQLIRQRADPL
jgi:hypothetical protein